MQTQYTVIPEDLTVDEVGEIVKNGAKLELSEEAREKISNCRAYLDRKLNESEEPVYGINTGFGSLHYTRIGRDDLETLQTNLVKSHACGTGDAAPPEVVKLMLLLKIQSLSYGRSGVQLETVQRLIDFYNKDIVPVVYTQGSLGASGDLAPLAHLSLPLIGSGEVIFKGRIVPAERALREAGLTPVTLRSKEGLALLNGTQFMSAYAVRCLLEWKSLVPVSEAVTALSLDVFDGRLEPYSDLPHSVRKQPGQLKVARAVRKLLEGSEISARPKEHVQDPYSFRCVPQVHGASYDAMEYVESVVNREISSVTDNPTVFAEEDEIISAGNFHGQPLALALDFTAIALSEMGSISERRIYKLVSGGRGLPEFLVGKPGLNSGFMIPQYTAASIASQNKQLCTPASIDSIDSSNGQEDHVSMGAGAAVKALKVMENVRRIISIELFNAAQALEFRRPLKTSPELEKLVKRFREKVPYVKEDTEMYLLIKEAEEFVKD